MNAVSRLLLALLVSALVHGLVVGLTAGMLAPALPDIEFKTPTEVEFGFVDTSPAAPALPPQGPTTEAPTEQSSDAEAALAQPTKRKHKPEKKPPAHTLADAGAKEPIADAGISDAGISDVGIADAGVSDASVSSREPKSPARPAGTHEGGAPRPLSGKAPPRVVASRKGAQVSLRVDMAALRASPLAAEYAALIRALPDVRGLLDGSGIDPLRDLSRLWVASPDLSRERAAIAGQYVGGRKLAQAAVKRLAETAGKEARFTRQQGVSTAPFHSPDGTSRVLALLGEQAFVVSRRSDLAAVLAVANRLSGGAAQSAGDLGKGLLEFTSDTIAQLDVEGVEHFVAAPAAQVPIRLTATIMPQDGGVKLHAEAPFASPEGAQMIERKLKDLVTRYAGHPLVSLMGLGHGARSVQVKRSGASLTLSATLNENEVRTLLIALRDSLPPDKSHGPPSQSAPAPSKATP